jgi:hypothetical protein
VKVFLKTIDHVNKMDTLWFSSRVHLLQWNLVCLLALNLSFALYYHHVFVRGWSVETMILNPTFSHKKFPSYFMMFYFQYLKHENHKNIVTYFVYFGFVY